MRPLLALLLCLAPPAARALDLPAPLRKLTDEAFAECREAGGTPALLADYVRTADLNGDGREDYLVDFAGLNCAGAESYFCGSAGCPVSVWASTPRGLESAWSGPAQGSRIDTSATPPAVEVYLHGQFCDPPRVGAEGCAQRVALAAPAEGAKAEAEAAPPARTAGWTLRAVPGAAPVAVSPAPAPLREIALFCLAGQPFLAALPDTPPPGETLRHGFAFTGRALEATARREPSAGGAFVADLRATPLAQALAGRDATARLSLDGVALGELSLAGSSKAIRGALEPCLPL